MRIGSASGGGLAPTAGAAMVTAALLSVVVAGAASPAAAGVVGGGGPARLDCLGVFVTPVDLPERRHHVRCVDGDPACDADLAANGECRFPVAICANSTFDASCSSAGVDSIAIDHSADDGDPLFDPDFQALQSRVDAELELPSSSPDDCTTATNVVVRLRGPLPGGRCHASRKVLRTSVASLPAGGSHVRDRDSLRLTCLPAPGGCDPTQLYSGTYDRIQRQIFDARCALGGCHDSQSQTAGLLLEAGAAHGELVGVEPSNEAAAAAGWRRVSIVGPTAGDPAASLLYAKLTGDLGVGFGARMPLGRKAVEAFLADIVRLWILAGAPQTGWVDGTDG